MKKVAALLLVLLSQSVIAAEVVSVVEGRILKQSFGNPDLPCPLSLGDAGCWHSWYLWHLRVDSVVAGPEVSKTVWAAFHLHAGYDPAYLKNFSLFVLQPIEDPQERDMYGAEYRLVDWSDRRRMHCLDKDPKEYGMDAIGISVFEDEASSSYCFELPEGE